MMERRRINPEMLREEAAIIHLPAAKTREVREFEALMAEARGQKRPTFTPEQEKLIRRMKRHEGEDYHLTIATLAASGEDALVRKLERITAVADAEADKRTAPMAVLKKLLQEECDLFRTSDGKAYADITIKGHRETLEIGIGKSSFSKWLRFSYFTKTGNMPPRDAMTGAIELAEGLALLQEGMPVREVFLRVAGIDQGGPDEKIYIDLCDDDWRVIEVTKKRWHIISADKLPEGVRFRRTPNMEALPDPDPDSFLGNLLRERLNYKSEGDYYLMVGWALNALRRTGQYNVLAIHGEQGSAKTTAMRVLRSLVDPQKAADRGLPKGEEDLQIRAEHAHVISFDNLSRIPPDISDAFCRLSTGGGSGTRTHYSNREESTFEAVRPIILNGIADVIGKADLAERTMRVELKVIDDSERKSEEAFWAAFNEDRPKILGGLLDALVEGLQRWNDPRPARIGRMADPIIWGIKCEGKFTRRDGAFVAAYEASQDKMKADALAGDSVALAIQKLLEDILHHGRHTDWQGSTEQLRQELMRDFGPKVPRGFPSNATALAKRIKVAMPALRAAGVIVDDTKRDSRTKSPILLIRRKAD